MKVAVPALLLALLANAPMALADPGLTDTVEVSPVYWRGVHSGCQAAFEVLHRNPEYYGNSLVLVSGSVSFTAQGDSGGLLLKLGVALVRDNPSFEAPTAAYLIDGYGTNASEIARHFDGERPGFRLFVFPLSDRTVSIVANSVVQGKFEVAYSMNAGSAGSRFVADMTDHPQQLVEWGNCVHALTRATQ